MADPVRERCDAIDDDSVLHLRWNSHVESLQILFETLLEQQSFVDVTLACEGGMLRAHRVMLSACSTYFRRVLHETAAKHPLIIMRDVSFSEMDAILQFMYRGEIHVPESRLASLLRTARLLEIRGLSDNLDQDEDEEEPPENPLQELHLPASNRKFSEQAAASADLNGSSWNFWPNSKTNSHTSLSSSVNGRNSQCKSKTQTKANDKDENHRTDSGDRQQQQYKRMKQSNSMDSQLPRVVGADNGHDSSLDKSGVAGVSDEENEVPNTVSSPVEAVYRESPSRVKNVSPVPVLVKCEALEFSTATTTAETEDGRSEEGDMETMTAEQYPFSMLEDQAGAVVVQAVCPFCFKDCKRTAELRAHIRAHTGEKPFRCDICSAPFARSAHLKRHRRVHTGERPFECHRCQKTFSRQDKLKLHMDRHRLRDTGGKMIVGRPKKENNKKNNATKNGSQNTASTSSTLSSSLPSPAAASTPTAAGTELGMGQFAFPGAPARPGPAQSPMSSGLPSPGLPLPFSDINYFSLLSFSQRGLAMTQGDSSTVPHLLTPQALQELQLYRKATSPNNRAATATVAGRGRALAKSRFTRHSVSESASETLLNFAQQAGETAAAAAAAASTASPPAQS